MAFGNGPRIVTDGLVLALDASDRNSYVSGSTIWRDVSGNNNSGSLVNGPTFSTGSGGAIVFDGTNDSISFPTITFTNTPYTIEISGNITGLLESGANRRSIFGNVSYAGEFSNTNTYFTNITVNSVDTYFNFGFGTAGNIVTGSNFHWVFTLDSSKNVFIYLNGRSITSANTQLTSYTNISSTFTRFGIWTTVRPYVGNLYLARMYNKALSAAEVLQNYNAQKSRFDL